MKKLIVLSLLLSTQVFANTVELPTEDDIALANEVISTSPMAIEGTYKIPEPESFEIPSAPIASAAPVYIPAPAPIKKPLTASEKLRLRRVKLEERNKIMMERRLERIRYQQELVLAKQLEDQLNKTFKAIQNIK